MKVLARLSFLLISILWGSFYALAKEALKRSDPVIFTFFEFLVLVPVALALIVIYRSEMKRTLLKRGVLLGSWLGLAMLTMTVAENYTGATNTAFFPSIGGVFAAIITGVILRRPFGKSVWVAGGISFAGMLVILVASGGGLEFRGDLIALLGAIFFTTYIFLVDHDRQEQDPQQGEHQFWLILGVENLTVAFWMMLVALLFGNWQHFHPIFPKDAIVITYAGTATAFIPVVISIFMQKHIEPLEISFIATLEPVWGAIIAYLYIGEIVSLPVYIGGALVIAGAIIHALGTSGTVLSIRGRRLFPPIRRYATHSTIGIISSPMILLGAGVVLLNWLGGFPPDAWAEIWHRWPNFSMLMSHGQEAFVIILCLRALCWFIAWAALIGLGTLTALSTARRLLALRSGSESPTRIAKYQSSDTGFLPTTEPRVATRKLTSPVAQRRYAQRTRKLGM